MTVFVALTGSGWDGDEQRIEGVYATRELAEAELRRYPRYRKEKDLDDQIEEWPVQTEAS